MSPAFVIVGPLLTVIVLRLLGFDTRSCVYGYAAGLTVGIIALDILT